MEGGGGSSGSSGSEKEPGIEGGGAGARLEVLEEFLEVLLECLEPEGRAVATVPPGLVGAGGGPGPRRSSRVPRPEQSTKSAALEVLGGGRETLGGAGAALLGDGGSSASESEPESLLESELERGRPSESKLYPWPLGPLPLVLAGLDLLE